MTIAIPDEGPYEFYFDTEGRPCATGQHCVRIYEKGITDQHAYEDAKRRAMHGRTYHDKP